MGTKKKKEPIVWTEERMQERLHNFRSNPRYVLKNLYVFGWESDLLFLSSSSGMWTEIEIKVSRADFLADLRNKTEKHEILKDTQNRMKPNRFFYAVPEGLVQPEEVPEYAGLIWVTEWFSVQTVIKIAPQLHRTKVTPEELKLADKFYYNMVTAKREMAEARRKADEILEPYKEGFSRGVKIAVEAAMKIMIQDCPHRNITEEGRIQCALSDVTQYNLCERCGCEYLEKKEEYIQKYINSR